MDQPTRPDPIPGGWAGGTVQQVIDWSNEAAGAKETYNLLAAWPARELLNGAGAMMRTVNNDPALAAPTPTGTDQTKYCIGVSGDDTVAHEWGHAYTEYTSNLIYAWQPGASTSPTRISGARWLICSTVAARIRPPAPVHPTAGLFGLRRRHPSTDNTWRWVSGEDDPGFRCPIRDMWRPECYGDPGR